MNQGSRKKPEDSDRLTHLDEEGRAQMVDVGEKAVTRRRAVASGRIQMQRATLDAIQGGGIPKGDVLAVARIAGIQAAKETSRWIPLCHSLPLDSVTVSFQESASGDSDTFLDVFVESRVTSRTGVEMEALTGASAALLTIYDMCKAIDRGMQIGPIQLEEKEGGRSGHWIRKSE